jgi:hypothetical protein
VHVGLECSYHSCRVDVWNVPVHPAEPLHVGPQTLSFLLWKELQIAGPPWFLMAAREGANKLMAQVSPGRDGVFRQVHQPRPHVWLECEREVVGEHFLISSPGSLNSDGVDAQELCWVQSPVILLWYLWLERASGRPMDLPQLAGEGRAPSLERQVPALSERGLVDVGAIAPIGLAVGVAMSLGDDTRAFPLPVLQDSPRALTRLRVGRSHRDVIRFLVTRLLCQLSRRGLYRRSGPIRMANSVGRCRYLGRPWRASPL